MPRRAPPPAGHPAVDERPRDVTARAYRAAAQQGVNGAGMVLAGALGWFIVIATGATLGATGTDVQTAALAAVAGQYPSLLFGVGLPA